MILAAFTKSAQFPFGGWLPKAMSAPTPVSSLVHRRTLVTAGIYILFNFNFIILSRSVIFFLLVSGIFTILFSRVIALQEEDLKKVIALSTLSQIGFSMMTLGLGLGFISFIHLLSHAFFKSCLFIQIGYIIYCSFGQQDGRSYSCVGNIPFFIQFQVLVSLFCLCGLFFTSGSVRKDLIIGFFFSNSFSFFFCLMFFISVFFTFCYSYRLWCSFFNTFSTSVYFFCSSYIFNFVSLILVFFSIFFIWWLNLNLLCIPCFFLYFDFYVPLIFVFLFFCLFFVSFNGFGSFFYGFLLDFFPLFFSRLVYNSKFIDRFLYSINFKFFNFFSFYSG